MVILLLWRKNWRINSFLTAKKQIFNEICLSVCLSLLILDKVYERPSNCNALSLPTPFYLFQMTRINQNHRIQVDSSPKSNKQFNNLLSDVFASKNLLQLLITFEVLVFFHILNCSNHYTRCRIPMSSLGHIFHENSQSKSRGGIINLLAGCISYF